MNQENAFPLGNSPDDDARSIVIEFEAHDVSRFEWRVAVPLPAHEHLNYTVQAEFELPSISILSPSPWDQLQGFTRLEEPQMVVASGDRDATAHFLRRRCWSYSNCCNGRAWECFATAGLSASSQATRPPLSLSSRG
jgi:hypothetical protein